MVKPGSTLDTVWQCNKYIEYPIIKHGLKNNNSFLSAMGVMYNKVSLFKMSFNRW